MKKPIKVLALILITISTFYSCKGQTEEPNEKEVATLKSAFSDNFYIGTALNTFQIEEKDSVQKILIPSQFNSITAENMMKSMHIHPVADTFNFTMSDKFVAFGEKYDMHIQGHALIWHSQLSRFFREIKDSTEMVNAMTNHIKTIVGRYKGKVDAWDVVNEALNEDGTLRKTPFLEAIGEDYLALAFRLTHEVDPEADLFYNDYNITYPNKRKGVINMIKKFQEQGVKIDGVGIQGHFGLDYPPLEDIENSIIEYAALGVKVDFSEVDVTVIPNPWDFTGADVNLRFESTDPTMNPYNESLPDSVQVQLAQRYQDIFKIFLKHQDKISRVTLWGVNDGDSWKNNWPIPGRTNYPLLFDRNNKPKLAYDSIMALKKIKE